MSGKYKEDEKEKEKNIKEARIGDFNNATCIPSMVQYFLILDVVEP